MSTLTRVLSSNNMNYSDSHIPIVYSASCAYLLLFFKSYVASARVMCLCNFWKHLMRPCMSLPFHFETRAGNEPAAYRKRKGKGSVMQKGE